MSRELRFGLERGKIFPHENARTLLNPLRRLVQPPGRLASRLGIEPGMSVLELGPGPGYLSVELARRVREGRLFLFDIQAEMLQMARARLRRADLRSPEAVAGDAQCLPFSPSSFDVVVLVAVLGEIPDPAACLREIRRVLRPNGLLSITEVHGDPDRIPWPSLRRLVDQAGYSLAKKSGWGWSYTANCEPR